MLKQRWSPPPPPKGFAFNVVAARSIMNRTRHALITAVQLFGLLRRRIEVILRNFRWQWGDPSWWMVVVVVVCLVPRDRKSLVVRGSSSMLRRSCCNDEESGIGKRKGHYLNERINNVDCVLFVSTTVVDGAFLFFYGKLWCTFSTRTLTTLVMFLFRELKAIKGRLSQKNACGIHNNRRFLYRLYLYYRGDMIPSSASFSVHTQLTVSWTALQQIQWYNYYYD